MADQTMLETIRETVEDVWFADDDDLTVEQWNTVMSKVIAKALTNARSTALLEAIEKVKEGIRPALMASEDYEYDFARNMGIADAIGALESMTTTQEVGNGK